MNEQKHDETKPQTSEEDQTTDTRETKTTQGESIEGDVVHLNEDLVENSAETSSDTNDDELAQAQEEIAKLKDGFLRAKAEQDNIRRRSEKEVANSRKFAVEGFAKEMLNVRDSLKLACSVELTDDTDAAIKSVHEGVEITLKQLDSAFAKFAMVEIAPDIGDKLDPNIHQAMSMIETDDVESGHIISVIQSGFNLHDRLLRPALVVVAK